MLKVLALGGVVGGLASPAYAQDPWSALPGSYASTDNNSPRAGRIVAAADHRDAVVKAVEGDRPRHEEFVGCRLVANRFCCPNSLKE